jgi:Nucleotidyltransferase domain
MALITDASVELPFVSVLYGSAARGDSDNLSDIDILVLGAGDEERHLDRDACVVRYQWSEICEMKSYGSLFIRHLRQHSLILDGNDLGKSWYQALLKEIPNYGRVEFDLLSFETAVDDCETAIRFQDTSPEFELASIATVMRHCSILGCYVVGIDEFSRIRPMEICCEALKLDGGIVDIYKSIYMFRIALNRGYPFPLSPSRAMVEQAIRMARTLILGVKKHASLADLR